MTILDANASNFELQQEENIRTHHTLGSVLVSRSGGLGACSDVCILCTRFSK